MATRDDQTPSPAHPPRLRIELVIAALLIAALASIYKIQMPGSFASTGLDARVLTRHSEFAEPQRQPTIALSSCAIEQAVSRPYL
jgi:hypothetical protein